MKKYAFYLKAVVAVVGAAVAALQTALLDDVILPSEWGTVVIALVTAIAVYAFPNKVPA
jgi:hypothetical protein